MVKSLRRIAMHKRGQRKVGKKPNAESFNVSSLEATDSSAEVTVTVDEYKKALDLIRKNLKRKKNTITELLKFREMKQPIAW